MMTADEVRLLFKEYATATSFEVSVASEWSVETLRAIVGSNRAANRDWREIKHRGKASDHDLIRIMRKRVAERRERKAA
jgi:hypothetical protein